MDAKEREYLQNKHKWAIWHIATLKRRFQEDMAEAQARLEQIAKKLLGEEEETPDA